MKEISLKLVVSWVRFSARCMSSIQREIIHEQVERIFSFDVKYTL